MAVIVQLVCAIAPSVEQELSISVDWLAEHPACESTGKMRTGLVAFISQVDCHWVACGQSSCGLAGLVNSQTCQLAKRDFLIKERQYCICPLNRNLPLT